MHKRDSFQGKPTTSSSTAKGATTRRGRRRTVELYNKYRNQVHFAVVDLDVKRSPAQQDVIKRYYDGFIPHVVILDAGGKALYNSDGEVDSAVIERIFEKSFAQATEGSAPK
jgi:hypothetical protein